MPPEVVCVLASRCEIDGEIVRISSSSSVASGGDVEVVFWRAARIRESCAFAVEGFGFALCVSPCPGQGRRGSGVRVPFGCLDDDWDTVSVGLCEVVSFDKGERLGFGKGGQTDDGDDDHHNDDGVVERGG